MLRQNKVVSTPSFQPRAFTQAIRHMLRPSRRARRQVAGLAVAGLVGLSTPAVAEFPAEFNLADLDGSNGFVLNGINRDDQSGLSAAAGDVNGDGLDDVIIGASSADPNGYSSAGESYVVFGRQAGFPAALNLADLDGSNGFVLNGINMSNYSGGSVAAAGDVNGDGLDDVIIGALLYGNDRAGESYVVFGQKTQPTLTPWCNAPGISITTA